MVFVVASIYRSVGEVTEHTKINFFAYVAAASIIYSCLVQLLGVAWHQIIATLDHPSISLRCALAIFNRSNIYKYLPGNFFHMFGRYALAKAAGTSHASLVFSQIAEIVLLAASSMIIGFAFSTKIL